MNIIRYRHYTLKAEDRATAISKLRAFLEEDTRRHEHGHTATLTSEHSDLHEVYTVEFKRDHHNEPYIAIDRTTKTSPTPRPFDPATFAQVLQESGRLGTAQVDDAPEHEAMTPWALMWQEAISRSWDRRDLAFALGMSVQALARVESGEEALVWPLARTLEMKFKIAASHWMALEHERTHEKEQ